VRAASTKALSLTPLGLRFLTAVEQLEPATSAQLARYLDVSQKAANRIGRTAFDMGLVSRTGVPRALLADPGRQGDAGLLAGSSPDIYTLTEFGIKALYGLGHLPARRPAKSYGPQSLFLAHTLMVRDLRLFFACASRAAADEELVGWREAGDAGISLKGGSGPKRLVPDAICLYRVGTRTLVSLLEADRGTERGNHGRWAEKLAAYDAFFRGGHLKELTGFTRGRVLTVTPSEARRDRLSDFAAATGSALVCEHLWFAERDALAGASLGDAVWRRPGTVSLVPLVVTGTP
jgi:hypothetical protein